ncbi:MAG: cysteine desulfurase [Candidatus Kapabacteria bacterium]|nr:cysteine desulfurase [Candidatus Kapabacteria bacterium]
MYNDTLQTARSFSAEEIRKDFPILSRPVGKNPLVYLDNAATTHKPTHVINSIRSFYESTNSNVHRGVHTLSQLATEQYESARNIVRNFLHASSQQEIVFTRGTTEGLNLLAQSFTNTVVGNGDEILLSGMEHHSNIVPWQMLAQRTGAIMKVIPVLDDGSLDMQTFYAMLTPKTKVISVVHISNSLGTVNPVNEIVKAGHNAGAVVIVDGAQSVAHTKIDVQEIGCDFFVFSGHKLYAPTGIGVLYGKRELLEKLPPYQGGGDMILTVSFEKTEYNELPYKFEAGTPNIEGAIGLAAAIEYLQQFDMESIARHEESLLRYATSLLEQNGVRIIGIAPGKSSIISFVLDGIHPHDVGSLLDRDGIAIRAGHHCTQPVMKRFSVPATNRASFAMYNTMPEVDALVDSLGSIKSLFA